jgi:hypothetical protein
VFRDLKTYKKLGLTKLGGQFWNIFFWADSTWGTVSGFQLKILWGQHQRDFFWTFVWPSVVWEHLSDLFESFLGTL